MIKNIESLNNFGVFRDYTNAEVQDFARYNLFYGWNGSGKSTLSSLFRCIEERSLPERFPSPKFRVNTRSDGAISQRNVAESGLNVYTFNNEFIEENIAWNDVVKSILLVDREKIDETEKLNNLKNRQSSDRENFDKEASEISHLEKSIEDFKTNSARNIKSNLQLIDTSDSYYMNYDKRRLKLFIDENLNEKMLDASLLDGEKINSLINTAKPDHKPSININLPVANKESLLKAKDYLNKLLKRNVVSQTIQRLVEHNEIKSWVESGLTLHKNLGATKCEFCENSISPERTAQLEAHFNDEYKAFHEKLSTAGEQLEDTVIQQPILPASGDLYDEFRKDYDQGCENLKNAIDGLNFQINAWRSILDKKIANPLDTEFAVETITEAAIIKFNEADTQIKNIIANHNNKSNNFSEETKKAKKQLELHYAAAQVKDFDYYNKVKDVSERTKANAKLRANIDAQGQKIQTLENSLSNESLGANEFNQSLHKFLGRAELTLRFNKSKKGYEIIRNNSELVKNSLSESEKTAIAFVYFIIKLKENDNNISSSIIVVDDPVSSFDSNYLFHAYSFLKANCKDAKQLFVLTHNFTFFKLVRDWFVSKNTRDNDAIAKFYMVQTNGDSPRASKISDAEPALIKYNSEYHYIFSRLHSLNGQQNLNVDDCLLAANLCRKLLEAFLSFKFPKNRGNFLNLFSYAVSKSDNAADENKERIYRFISKYSHHDQVEIDGDSIANITGEGPSVISAVFRLIEELDEGHYEEMTEALQ